MELRAPIIEADQTFDIKLQNGILRNGTFIPIDYQEFTPYSIDIPYHEDAEAVAIVDEYINHLTNGEAEYKMRLLEILAHPLIVDKEFKRLLAKFFIFVGGWGKWKRNITFDFHAGFWGKKIAAVYLLSRWQMKDISQLCKISFAT